MPWRRAEFKGQRVWAEVDPTGALKVSGGRVGIRYQRSANAKIYAGTARNVALEASAPVEAFEDGTPAPPLAAAKRAANRAGGSSGFGKAGTRTEKQAAMAAEAARALIDSLDGAILAFTDGACRGNPGPAGAGAVLRFPGGRHLEASRSLGRATNNIAELTAIQLALQLLVRAKVDPHEEVALFTDSAYSHGVLVKSWKPKANQELIKDLRARLARWPNLELYWIAGHVGVEENERADELANEGVDGISAVHDSAR